MTRPLPFPDPRLAVSPHPRRSVLSLRRLLALALALVLVSGPVFAAAPQRPARASAWMRTAATPAPAGQQAQTGTRERQPRARLPVSVVLSGFSPKYAREKSVLRARGQLVNQSESSYQQLSVRLRYGSRPLATRGAIDAYSRGLTADAQLTGPGQVVTGSLQPGGQAAWSLALPVRTMGLPQFGVYPVSVEVYDATGAVRGRQRTLLTYYPKAHFAKRTKIAWVWPVVDQPHRADDATFVDDRLERQLASGGRLAGLVAAARQRKVPVSWLVDPALVDDAARMAQESGYTVDGFGKQTHRPRSAAAKEWLTSLREAFGRDQVIMTPYADPDVVGLARARMGKDIKFAMDVAGRSVAPLKLPADSTTTVSLPPDGLADQATLTALSANGARTFLLSSELLHAPATQTFTADARAQIRGGGRPLEAIAYDATLNQVLSADTSEPGEAVLTEQRFLAETAMITGERPQQSRTLVVAPPRRWDVSGTVARNLLNHTAKAPWLQPIALKDVQAGRVTGRTFQPARDVHPLSSGHLRQVRALDRQIRQFATIFQPPLSGFEMGIPRMESSAWRGQARRGPAYRSAMGDRLDAAMSAIKVINSQVDLAGKSGSVPITVDNRLPNGDVTIRLRLSSQNGARLAIGDYDGKMTISAGHKNTIHIPMQTKANGFALVDMQLETPDGQPLGKRTVLRVHTTGYGRTALIITGVSLVVLFLGVGVRVIRRRGDRAEASGD